MRVSGCAYQDRQGRAVRKDTMGYQECSVGRDVKVDMKSLREQKRLEAEGTSGATVCMVLLTFFFGCKLATEEGRSR